MPKGLPSQPLANNVSNEEVFRALVASLNAEQPNQTLQPPAASLAPLVAPGIMPLLPQNSKIGIPHLLLLNVCYLSVYN